MLQISIDIHKPKPEIMVSFGGESIGFCGSVFQRDSFEVANVFEPANAYLGRLTMAQQQQIWEVYKRVDDSFNTSHDAEVLQHDLTAAIAELAQLVPLPQLEHWVSIDPGFVIPSDVQDTFIQDEDGKNSPKKTYLRRDYLKLMAFAIFVRFLMPIFGEYIESTRRNTGVDFKEYEALKLLMGTGLLESEAMIKLFDYTDQITKEKHRNPERILKGISSEDMCFYLVALTVIRKISISDVRGLEPKSNLAAKLYVYLIQRAFNPPKTQMPIRERDMSEGGESSEQSKRSILESYRKRAEISIGDKAGFEFGYEDTHGSALRMVPGIPEQEVQACLNTVLPLHRERISDAQIFLTSWVFKHVHSPCTAMYIKKKLLADHLGVLEAVLWSWGFKYLAVLASSYVIRNDDSMQVAPMDARGQIPEEYRKQIIAFFPHTWANLRRSSAGQIEEPNPVLHAIDLCVDELVSNAYWATASNEKLKEVFGEVRRRTPIFPTIKTELAKLLIYIEENNSGLRYPTWLTPSA